MNTSFDVVIVGGGVMGASVACHLLALDPKCSVCVVERDPTYRFASSALSASSIRQQFSTPINIAMSRFGFQFYRDIARHLSTPEADVDIGLVERGYLYLADASGADALRRAHQIQLGAGVDVALLDPAQLRHAFPWLATDGLALGSLGRSGEGWFDGYSVLQAFRRKARALGATFIADSAAAFEVDAPRVNAVTLASGRRLHCGAVVNAAGPHARAVAAMAGIDLPVYAERHCVFVFECPQPPLDAPLVIDPSGAYFRPEGRQFIGGAPPDPRVPPTDSLDVDHAEFDQVLWPCLARRVPAFEALRSTGAWAGHYEMNRFDGNAIIGRTSDTSNLYLVNGFSGHGMQHAPAAGLGLAELIVHGAYRTLDLTPLSYARIVDGRPLRESNII